MRTVAGQAAADDRHPRRLAAVDPAAGQHRVQAHSASSERPVGTADHRCRTCGQSPDSWATDRLTGLANRWGWDTSGPQIHGDAHRRGEPVALLAVDIDHFKRVNDEYGHPAGDAILSAVAAVLREVTRPTDLSCRYGGDEFLVLAPGLDVEATSAMATEIRAGIKALVITARAAIDWTVTLSEITASIGAAVHLPGSEFALTELLLHADTGLREAKRGGRDKAGVAELPPAGPTTHSVTHVRLSPMAERR
ncbi:MAG TPA: GGDEF domain-containing protein [Pseudonocardiaceae bacterium]|jgi:diguanylate cyclase (GGDEF)-like protein|nr:GGDEF domain-containing protein [Pseudonocardiaceae bacterium]